MLFTESGKCFVFGSNNFGQLGLGHRQFVRIPTELCIPSANNSNSKEIITFLAHDTTHGFVLTKSGKCFGFGNNESGQVGVRICDSVITPTELCIPMSGEESSNEIITFVTCKYNITAVLTKSEKCFVFGDNELGQLGLGHTNAVHIPTELCIHNETIIFAACGDFNSIILTKSNKCFVFGYNGHGQLGLGHTNAVHIPTELCIHNETIIFAACGDFNSIVLTKSNKCFVFGANGRRQLGLGHTNDVHIPTELCIPKLNSVEPGGIADLTNEVITFVTCGDYHSIILTKSNKCFVFGDNSNGELGTILDTNKVTIPTEIKMNEKIVKLMNQRNKTVPLEWEKQRLLWIARRNTSGPFSRLPHDMIREIVRFY